MPNRRGYFLRTDPSPYRVRLDLTGPVTLVKQNEVIFADYFTFKDVIGFKFVGWTPPASVLPPDPTNPDTPIKIKGFENIKMVGVSGAKQAPHKEFLKSIKENKAEPPTEVVCAEDGETVEPLQALIDHQKTVKDKENDKLALIAYLSKFDNKKWFVMKKEDARDYIDRLELDRSNLPNSKNEFIKLLKDYIKSLG